MFHTVSIHDDVMQKIKKIQTIFVEYTGEEITNRPEEKVIDFLADGFISQVSGQFEGGCGENCGCTKEGGCDCTSKGGCSGGCAC